MIWMDLDGGRCRLESGSRPELRTTSVPRGSGTSSGSDGCRSNRLPEVPEGSSGSSRGFSCDPEVLSDPAESGRFVSV